MLQVLCYVYTWSQQQIGVCQYPEYLEEAGQIQSLKNIGCGRSVQEIAALKERARIELSKFEKPDLIVSKDDCFIESFVSTFSTNQLRIAGPELIPGKI